MTIEVFASLMVRFVAPGSGLVSTPRSNLCELAAVREYCTSSPIPANQPLTGSNEIESLRSKLVKDCRKVFMKSDEV